VPSFPYETAREIIKHDLGKYPEQLFRSFDPEPIASASISQVYKAVMRNGKVVAVKVRRPWIGKPIEQDIAIARRCMKVAQLFSPTLRKTKIIGVVDEINMTLLKEIDFRNEMNNILGSHAHDDGRMGKKVRKDLGAIFIPQVYPEFCSYNVLTTEFLEGVTLNNYGSVKDDPDYDAVLSVKTLANGAMMSLFEEGHYYFHADPHPANIMLMKGGNVGLLDYGIVGEFDKQFTRQINDLFFAVYLKDVDATLDAMLAFSKVDKRKWKEKLRPEIEEYLAQTSTEGIGFWFMALGKVYAKHGLPVPRKMALFGRMNIIADGLIHMVEPGATTVDFVGPELRRGVQRRMVRNIKEMDYAAVLYNLSEKARRNPEVINRLIEKYSDDPMRIFREFQRA
jgi:ubiquinone biosynthesis protein